MPPVASWGQGLLPAILERRYKCRRVPEQVEEEKPVWRVAFFSRFEERKGVKVFVAALQRLQDAVSAGKDVLLQLDPRFEVHFVGADARIDMRPSSEWLRAKTASWKCARRRDLTLHASLPASSSSFACKDFSLPVMPACLLWSTVCPVVLKAGGIWCLPDQVPGARHAECGAGRRAEDPGGGGNAAGALLPGRQHALRPG